MLLSRNNRVLFVFGSFTSARHLAQLSVVKADWHSDRGCSGREHEWHPRQLSNHIKQKSAKTNLQEPMKRPQVTNSQQFESICVRTDSDRGLPNYHTKTVYNGCWQILNDWKNPLFYTCSYCWSKSYSAYLNFHYNIHNRRPSALCWKPPLVLILYWNKYTTSSLLPFLNMYSVSFGTQDAALRSRHHAVHLSLWWSSHYLNLPGFLPCPCLCCAQAPITLLDLRCCWVRTLDLRLCMFKTTKKMFKQQLIFEQKRS